jgi:hypothetical protein
LEQVAYHSVFYPAELKLPEGYWFRMEMRDEPVAICVHQKLSVLRVLDLDNAIVATEGDEHISVGTKTPIHPISSRNIGIPRSPSGMQASRFVVVDYGRYPHRSFVDETHTELIVGTFFDAKKSSESALDIFGEILRCFLDTYRHATKDVTVSRPDVLLEKLVVYEAQEHSRSKKTGDKYEQLVSLESARWGVKEVTTSDRTESSPAPEAVLHQCAIAVQDALQTGVREDHRLLVNAFDELVVRRNATYAFLEAFITAELSLARAVQDYEKALSPAREENRKRDPGLRQMLEKDLPRVLGKLEAEEQAVLDSLNALRSRRNDVVHRGQKVSEADALAALNAVNRLILLLSVRLQS